MNLFKALFGSSFFQQEMKRNQQYRDNYACCDDIDVNIDLAEEIENETIYLNLIYMTMRIEKWMMR